MTKKGSKSSSGGKLNPTRERIVRRAAQEFKVQGTDITTESQTERDGKRPKVSVTWGLAGPV